MLAIVAPKIGGVTTAKGKKLPADQALSGAPSVMFDAVAVLPSEEGAALLAKEAAAVDWLRDAFGHLKVDRPCRRRRADVRQGGSRAGCRRRAS